MGEENPQNCPFPLRFRHRAEVGPSQGHRQHAQRFGKDCVHGSGDMLVDRQTYSQTDRHTHTDIFITILRHHSAVQVTKSDVYQ